MAQENRLPAGENKMATMPEGKLLFNMALPIIIAMLVQALYNVVDSIYVSRISESAVTALSLAFPVQNIMIGFATGIGVGVNSLLSKSLGENNQDAANRAAGNGIFLLLLSTVLFILFGIFGARPFFEVQSDIAETVNGGSVYVAICCIGSIGIFVEILGERLLQASGRTFYTMITQGVGAIVNIVLDPVFIFGVEPLGIAPMGIAGAAIATVIGQWIAAILAVQPGCAVCAVLLQATGRFPAPDPDRWHPLHHHDGHRLCDEFRHESDPAGLQRDRHRRVWHLL